MYLGIKRADAGAVTARHQHCEQRRDVDAENTTHSFSDAALAALDGFLAATDPHD